MSVLVLVSKIAIALEEMRGFILCHTLTGMTDLETWLFCVGKDKTASNVPSVLPRKELGDKAKMSHKQQEEKAKMSSATKPAADSNLFTESQSGIRIV